jgi:hypothetical protein
MVSSKGLWIAVIYLPLILIGCSLQADQETSQNVSIEPGAGGEELAQEPVEIQLSTKPSAGALAPAATAISSTTSTRIPEQTIESENQKANADVIFVKARQETEDTWHFSVTVQHPDRGWEDYADGWDIVLPDGSVAKADPSDSFTRLLLHPHETEQPFTRSQGGIFIEPGVTVVTVRAHDLVDGFGGREIVVDLMSPGGPDFEVHSLTE